MANNRIRWSATVRSQVFEASQGRCGICGADITDSAWVLDHIVPLATGGTDVRENLQPAHDVCNGSKSAGQVTAWQGRRTAPVAEKSSSQLYHRVIDYRHYAAQMAGNDGNPFVQLSRLKDGGVMARNLSATEVRELNGHGAWLVDARGQIVESAKGASMVIWPHVAMRDPKYNGNIDSGLDRVKGRECGFPMTGSGRTEAAKRKMVAEAALRWLA